MRQDRGTFWRALAVTLTVLATALALVTVDARGRAMTLGDDAPPLARVRDGQGSVSLEIHLFGLDKTVDFTNFDNFLSFLLDFGCIPHK